MQTYLLFIDYCLNLNNKMCKFVGRCSPPKEKVNHIKINLTFLWNTVKCML